MAAVDNFAHFNDTLSKDVRVAVAELIKGNSEELLAARSEDARIRIVEAHQRAVNARMKRLQKAARQG
jgi:hypothetical protein